MGQLGPQFLRHPPDALAEFADLLGRKADGVRDQVTKPRYLVRVVRYRVLISGRVQGVFFRDSCRRMAVQHGVNGWVRNLPDGSVEAVFEGPAGEVGRLVEWSRRGPRHAVVEDVRVAAEPPEGISGFQVR